MRARPPEVAMQGLRGSRHGRQKSTCKDCGGTSICEHGRLKSQSKECGGTAFCEHGRLKS
jgi:hypothetical protein